MPDKKNPEDRSQGNFVPIRKIFWAYLQVGLTAFGFAILPKLKKLVKKNGWLTENELAEGLALVQLYPGPIMVNLNTYVGYKKHGLAGAIAATVAFIIPTTVFMLILSYLYFSFGKISWVKPLFIGLEALVIGVLLNVVLDFGRRSLKGSVEAVIAVASFSVLVLHFNVVLLVFFALAVGALLLKPENNAKTTEAKIDKVQNIGTTASGRRKSWWKVYLQIGLALLFVLAGVVLALKIPSPIGKSALSFFKIGSVAFGNGLTILPLIQADAVEKYHWLTLNQFMDGIALSQITPGPFLVIATFIGFKLGGMWASLLTTFAMFSPSFVFTIIFTEIFSHVKKLAAVRGALAGVLSAFVGLLAAMLLQLGVVVSNKPTALIFAAGSFVAVQFFKLDILWIFGGGLALWAGMYFLGVPLL